MPPDVLARERLFQSQNQSPKKLFSSSTCTNREIPKPESTQTGSSPLWHRASVWKRGRLVTHLFFIYFIFCILSWPEHCTNSKTLDFIPEGFWVPSVPWPQKESLIRAMCLMNGQGHKSVTNITKTTPVSNTPNGSSERLPSGAHRKCLYRSIGWSAFIF